MPFSFVYFSYKVYISKYGSNAMQEVNFSTAACSEAGIALFANSSSDWANPLLLLHLDFKLAKAQLFEKTVYEK